MNPALYWWKMQPTRTSHTSLMPLASRPQWQLPRGVPRGVWEYSCTESIATDYDVRVTAPLNAGSSELTIVASGSDEGPTRLPTVYLASPMRPPTGAVTLV